MALKMSVLQGRFSALPSQGLAVGGFHKCRPYNLLMAHAIC